MTPTPPPLVDTASRSAFPFSALVGQPELQRALLLAAIDPGIGGVLISGPRGTAKSTAARALAGLLPSSAPFATLPLSASIEQLVGTLDVEQVLRDNRMRLSPGLLARAHDGVLFVDEVNLLPDALVDALLDVAASGVNTVERDGISRQHAARFVLLGTMNPEEGELRPQLSDRFGLSVVLASPTDLDARMAILRARLGHDEQPQAWGRAHGDEQARLASAVAAARAALPRMAWPDTVLRRAASCALAAGVDGMRADLVMLRAARALAALEGRTAPTADDVDAVAALALAHRRPERHQGAETAPPADRRAAAPSPTTLRSEQHAEGDWGALPPRPEATTRPISAGGWPAKKA